MNICEVGFGVRFEFTAVISWKYKGNIGRIIKSNSHAKTHAGTSSSLLYQTWFHIIRTTRLSAIDNRYNQSKTKKQHSVRRKHTNVRNETFRNNNTVLIRTKNRTTILRVTLTVNKVHPHTPKRRHDDVHMTASNFKEQKNIPKRQCFKFSYTGWTQTLLEFK
jgi:hypothetical protein